MSKSKPIAITMGDPAGIGPEIIAKLFRDAPLDAADCVVIGDVTTMRRASELVDGLPVISVGAGLAHDGHPSIPVLQKCELPEPVPYGLVSHLAGKAAADCVLWAAEAVLRGEFAAVVTAPMHKVALMQAGPQYAGYQGHTQWLQARAAAFLGKPVDEVSVRMMLANDEIKTVLVSIHLSLRAAVDAVTFDAVLKTLRITHQCLRLPGGAKPRIAVAGLNPHAGENGLFGREEIDVIAPAISQARTEGIDAHGPFSPDTVFMRARAQPGKVGEFDVVVAMYHDQGLIPVKYLGVERGVNVTLGLPLVRTSPDHGTAFDIAGTGQADASSLLQALRVARDWI